MERSAQPSKCWRAPCGRHSADGFGLIEAIVALAIVSAVVTGGLTALAAASTAAHRSGVAHAAMNELEHAVLRVAADDTSIRPCRDSAREWQVGETVSIACGPVPERPGLVFLRAHHAEHHGMQLSTLRYLP